MLVIMINILGAVQKDGALLLPWGSKNKLQNCKRLQVELQFTVMIIIVLLIKVDVSRPLWDDGC